MSRRNKQAPMPQKVGHNYSESPEQPLPPPLHPMEFSFFGGMFRAFGYRQFRLLWTGAFTSSVGSWMQKVAQSWLVISMTGSAFLLGLDSFLGDLPILLFSLVGGVIADRVDRRKMLLASQYLQMTLAFVLAGLIYLDQVRVWHILLLSFLAGTAQSFGGPAYQALIPSLVERRDVPNAVALNSIQFNLARVIGPMLAGLALAQFGSAACFGLNGLSFVAVIVSLYLVQVNFMPKPRKESLTEDMRGGLAFVRGNPALKALTGLAFASTFLGIPLITMLPLFARDVFQIGSAGYSRLMTFSGMGAVLGALVVAGLGNLPHRGRNTLVMQGALGLLVMAFAFSRTLWLSYALLFLGGVALISVFALISSLVQLAAPDELRGRIMSIYMLAFRGGMPLGSLMAGTFSSHFPVSVVLGCGGLLLFCAAVSFFLFSRPLRTL
jgi:MFS family permease